MRRSKRAVPRLATLTVALLLGACAGAEMEPPSGSETPLVWPPAPAPPRIRFVRVFSSPVELGIAKGFLENLGEVIAGRAEGRFTRPMAVVATAAGVLYVADPGSQGVHRLDPARRRHDLIRGKDGAPLPSPIGLSAGPGGEVYLSDSLLNEVLVIAPESKTAIPVALKTRVEQPTGIALDPRGREVYVVDTSAHQVKVFATDGTLRSTFGRRGAGDGEFNYPTMIWRDREGRLLVTDSLNFRVQIFDAGGKFLGKFGQLGDATGDMSRPKGVATDRFGHVYVVDSLFHAVQIFSGSGEFLLSFGGQGQRPGEFWLPAGIFVTDDETIYVADSYNKRIQVFRYVGGQS